MGSEMTFYERLSTRGVSRRDFLKFCGSTAAVLGLSSTFVPTIASKIAGASESGLTPALWINGGACTGCTESIAQAAYPNVAEIVLDFLSLNAAETISMATGEYAEGAIDATVEDGTYILLYEGTVMTGLDGNVLRVGGVPQIEHLEHLAEHAAVVIAMGSCAVDGGWVISSPNPAGGMGVSEYLKKKNIKVPVVNLPGCPVNPEELVAVVVQALLLGADGDLDSGLAGVVKSLDSQGRPGYLYSATIHDSCPRRGHFENGEFVYKFGSEAEAKKWCLYPVGCKGPQTYRQCPMLRWNNTQSWCVDSGGPCIGCATFNWVDNNAPFRGRMRQVGINSVGEAGLNPATAAAAVGGVAAVALVAHGFGMKAAGRIGPNATLKDEPMKEYDAKRLKKKGGAK